jgi:hypothetical protein
MCPGYTFCSGHTRTTVDYIIVNQCASYLMTTSEVLGIRGDRPAKEQMFCSSAHVHNVDLRSLLPVLLVESISPVRIWVGTIIPSIHLTT